MAYPTSLDNLSESYLGTDQVSVVDHAGMHNAANAAINDLQVKLGIDSSAVTTSIDYLLKSSSSSDPGHKHTVASLTGIPDGSGTTNEISYWVDSNTLGALAVATYPSLTELSYVKGVTSAIQTQINAKFTLPSLTAGSVLFSDGSTIAQDNSNFYWNDTTNRLGIGAGTTGLTRFTVKQAATGAITGTSNTNNSTTVTGSGTLFLSEVGVGDMIEENGFGYVQVTAIASNTSLTVRPSLPGDYNPNALNTKKAMSRWEDSSGEVRMLLSYDGHLGIGSTVFDPLYPLTIIDPAGVAIGATNTGRKYVMSIDDPSGATVFSRSDVTGNLTIAFGTAAATFSSTTATQLSFQINGGQLNFVSANGGGAGKITFGRRVSDNNVAVGAAVEFWPTSTQTTPAAAVTAPGGASYRLKLMPDGSIEFTNSGSMVFNTTTGTKIGTATTQKLAFYNSTPIVQPANTVAINDVLVNLGLRASGGVSNFTTNIDISTKDIVTDTTTGTKIGTATTQKIGLWNATPVVQPTALTAQLTSITHTAPGTPDYAIQDLVDSSGGAAFGFATKDEGNTVLSVIANLQARVQELEDKLQSFGAIAQKGYMAQLIKTVNFPTLTASELRDYLAESFGYDGNHPEGETKNQYNERMLTVLLKGQVATGRQMLKYKTAANELSNLEAN